MKEAEYYIKLNGTKVRCTLCPHNCEIENHKIGLCKVRKNISGKLFSEIFSSICSTAYDPIEKKPLYHFYPGADIFSIGTVGCNLGCKFCQNWEISQTKLADAYTIPLKDSIILEKAKKNDSIGIAYTYNEPIIWFEYIKHLAPQVKDMGLKNVIVTNGFINTMPLKSIIPLIDAFNIDLKAFTEDFYFTQTHSELAPVKANLKTISYAGKHLEITNLVIPGHNDNPADFKDMVNWIAGELGPNTVLHLSKYFPKYKFKVKATEEQKLIELREIALQKLNYVYLGNVSSKTGSDSYCHHCGNELVRRTGSYTLITGLKDGNTCHKCGEKVPFVNN